MSRRADIEAETPRERRRPARDAETRPGTPDATPAAADSVNAEVLAAENASLRDRILRALADAENTRRRAERSAQDASRYAIADFARELLAVADNLQRSIAAAERHSPKTAEDTALLEGVRATERTLMQALERFGVRRIAALGAPFDPTLHEAVMEVEDGSYPPGSVARVLEDGYTIHDRLLRAARVAVAKHRPNTSPAAGDAAAPEQAPSQSRSSRQP